LRWMRMCHNPAQQPPLSPVATILDNVVCLVASRRTSWRNWQQRSFRVPRHARAGALSYVMQYEPTMMLWLPSLRRLAPRSAAKRNHLLGILTRATYAKGGELRGEQPAEIVNDERVHAVELLAQCLRVLAPSVGIGVGSAYSRKSRQTRQNDCTPATSPTRRDAS
jgi:hypothetical protein